MLTSEEILETLPKLLKEKPILKVQLYSILSEEYVTKNEFIEYIKKYTEQWKEYIKEADERWEKQKKEFDERWEKQKKESDEKWEREKKESDEKWEKQKRESDEKWEKQRLEFRKEWKEYIERTDKRFESLEIKLTEVKSAIGSIGKRIGHRQEELILAIFKKELEWRNIDVNQVKHLVVTDEDGELFQVKNSPVEIDIYLHNGLHILLKIEHFFDEKDDVYLFYRKANFIDKKLGINSRRVIIAVEILEDIYSLAESLGMEIITREKVKE